MSERSYSIAELTQLTGLPRRTIHFYVGKGLIPAPSSKGGPARYGEEALIKLQMIRILQGSHLKLDGIRQALAAMSLAEMRQKAALAEGAVKTWDDAAVGSWLTSSAPASVPPPAPR